MSERERLIGATKKFLDDRGYFENDYGYRVPEGYDKEMLLDHFADFYQAGQKEVLARVAKRLKSIHKECSESAEHVVKIWKYQRELEAEAKGND